MLLTATLRELHLMVCSRDFVWRFIFSSLHFSLCWENEEMENYLVFHQRFFVMKKTFSDDEKKESFVVQ
jgi:hypothetical protein